MFELTFLGTSASAPSIARGLSSALVQYRNHRFMIDCGEGTQRQLLRSGLGFRRLNKIFITHGHLDHILGLAGLLSTIARWDVLEETTIYAGTSARNRIERLFEVVFGPHLPPQITLQTIQPGVLFADEHVQVEAFPVVHRGPDCYGFLFSEKVRPMFLVAKAEALGVPAGPERRKLVAGEAVTLADGRVIMPDDVLGDPRPAVRLAFIGDLAQARGLGSWVQDANALVVEATYLDEDRALARKFGHFTAGSAARLARRLNVGQLILTHLSRRYEARMVLAEAQAIFPNTIVANDFDHFEIK